MHLSHHELLRLEVALGILYAATSLRSLQQRAIRATATLIDGLWVTYNETDSLPSGQGVSIASPDAPGEISSLYPMLHRLWHTHPILRSARPGRDNPAQTFADGMPRPAVERLDLYNLYYRALGVKDQLVILLSHQGERMRCLSVNRDKADFTEQERWLLQLLRPHFEYAHRHVSLLDHLTAAQAMVVVAAGGVVEFISENAARWLMDACGTPCREGALAPAALRGWLDTQKTLDAAHPPEPLDLIQGRHRFTLRITRRDAERTTIVVEQSAAVEDASGWARLTAREREVLGWLAHGKSNPEIADILAMSRRTVEKHMESILAKLALENRAAVMLAAIARGVSTARHP